MRKYRNRSVLCGACALALAAALFFLAVAQDLAERNNVRTGVLRLHVIANSDEELDQSVKLQVRDALLEQTAALFTGAATESEAEESVRPRLALLEQTANRVLKRAGLGYKAKAALTREYFNARAYGDLTLPAGTYAALRVTLGEGNGKNWWCVMFPPLCIPAAQNAAADVFSEGEKRVLSPAGGFQVRFKVAEWLDALWQKLAARRERAAH